MSLLDGFVAYYPLSNEQDASPGGRHLANVGGVTFTPGKVADAGTFVRATQHHLRNSSTVFALTDGFTLTCWLKLASKPAGPMNAVDRHNSSLHGWSLFWDNTGDVFRLRIGNSSGAFTDASWGSSPSTDTWYFVACGYRRSDSLTAISVDDGTPQVNLASAALADAAVDFSIGAWGDGFGSFWDGQIDEVGMWSRLLTAAEVTTLYNGGAGLGWPFGQGGGAFPRGRDCRREYRYEGTVVIR